MGEDFVALASMLRRDGMTAVALPVSAPIVAVAVTASPMPDPSPLSAVATELVRLRLAAREAFEDAMVSALEGFAREVLGRELSLAPADIRRLAERAGSDFAKSEPVGLVVSSDDAALLAGFPLPLRVDDELQRGDVVVEVTGGAFASTLAFRLKRVLDESFASAWAGLHA